MDWQLHLYANQNKAAMCDTKKLARAKWNCKYHIVFAQKYRRCIFYREKRRAIEEILRKLYE